MAKKCMWKDCLASEKAKKIVKCKLYMTENYGYALASLFARLWIALVFWKSAATKVVETSEITIFGITVPLISLPYQIQESTYWLFADEYAFPFPEFMTMAATFAEILLPILLVFGFGGRIAALGLFIMTIIIELTYMHAADHIVWLMVTAILFTAGSGRISVDHFIRKCYFCEKGCKPCKE